jgi:group I intron endonuclease
LSNLPFLAAGFPLHESLKAVPTSTGVYAIHCSVNDFVYFGSAAGLGFRSRFNRHVKELQRGIHHSPILQKHYDRYGAEPFSFHILELCLPGQALQHEQTWIDLRGVGSKNRSFNIAARAGIAPSRLGEKQRPDTIAKRVQHRLNNPLPPEVMERIKQGIAEANSLAYVVTSPEGREMSIKNLTKFCRNNGLIAGQMINVAKAIHDQHKGWRCRYTNESKEEHQSRLNRLRRNREYLVTFPDGSEFVVKNLKQFCRDKELSYAAMAAIVRAVHLQTHDGWKCQLVNEPEVIRQKRLALQGKNKRYIVTFPNGQQAEIEGLPAFCKEHELCCSTMTKVALGKHFQHKGFKLRYAEDSIDDRNDRLKHRKNNREYIVTDPDGNEFLTNSLKSFAQAHNVSHSALSKLVYGETLDGKTGWQCRLAWETEAERRARVLAKFKAKRLKDG